MAKLVVTKVLDSNVQVHMPTNEVTKVGEALTNFIQWLKRLLRLVTNKEIRKMPFHLKGQNLKTLALKIDVKDDIAKR
ncbi:unnamed protein product [Lathyrus oleraceus]